MPGGDVAVEPERLSAGAEQVEASDGWPEGAERDAEVGEVVDADVVVDIERVRGGQGGFNRTEAEEGEPSASSPVVALEEVEVDVSPRSPERDVRVMDAGNDSFCGPVAQPFAPGDRRKVALVYATTDAQNRDGARESIWRGWRKLSGRYGHGDLLGSWLRLALWESEAVVKPLFARLRQNWPFIDRSGKIC
jgi:hypothetical protein